MPDRFPMTAAWVVLINHLEQARYDLTLITDLTIPSWVDGAVSQPRHAKLLSTP